MQVVLYNFWCQTIHFDIWELSKWSGKSGLWRPHPFPLCFQPVDGKLSFKDCYQHYEVIASAEASFVTKYCEPYSMVWQ